MRIENKNNKYKSSYISSFQLLTELLKQQQYKLLIRVAEYKQMSKLETYQLLKLFWKKEYYTPEIVSNHKLEDAQLILANNRILKAHKSFRHKQHQNNSKCNYNKNIDWI